jgi:hypothetical protein
MTLNFCERFAGDIAMLIIGVAYGLCQYAFLFQA